MAYSYKEKPRLCLHCGAPLAGNELAGNCPRCLATALLSPGASEPVDTPLAPAVRRLGDYELLEEVARGGMGVVFRARQLSLGREVAVKVLRDAWLASPAQVKRFRAEAANAAKLKHPNIVAVHEVGEHGGQHFFAMDLVTGTNLAELTREGPLAPRRVAELVAKVAEAVQHAHQQGVLHRDLKPSNVLLDEQGEPHVTDFGLARPIDDESSLTLTGQVLGTPGYMAPEQVQGDGTAGPAADVYGLGALLFHLLTGRPPFVGASVADTLAQVVQREPLSPRLLNPAVPLDLAAVCVQCLQKSPARRYRSAEALAQDLESWQRGEPIRARPTTLAERLLKWGRRNPTVAGLSAAAALALALGAAGVLWEWRAAVRARAEAQQNAGTAERELRRSQLAQLELIVGSRRLGHRLESLRLIQNLVGHDPSKGLRDLAITALGSSDARQLGSWHALPLEPSCPPAFDGQLGRVALGDPTGWIKLFAFPDFVEHGRLSLGGSTAGSITWANHDQWLVAALADGRVVLWDVDSLRVRFATNGCYGPGRGQRLAVHPSGKFLVMSGSEKQIRVFDLEMRRESPPIVLAFPVESLAFNSAGDKLAVSYKDHFQVRAFPSLSLLTEDVNSKYFANQMVWEPGDRWLLAAMQGWNVLRWHPGMGSEGQVFGSAHDAAALSLCRNDTGALLLSSGADNTSYLWDAAFPYSLLTLPNLTALRFAHTDLRFALWHKTQGLGIFEVIPSTEARNLVGNPPHIIKLTTCSPHISRPLVAAASQFHAALFDLEAGEDRVDIELADCAGAFLSGDGELLITVSHDGVQAWPILRPNDSTRSKWKLAPPRLLAEIGTNFLPQATGDGPFGERFVATGSTRAVVVDLRNGSVVQELPPPERSAFSAMAPDGSWWVHSQIAPESTWLAVSGAQVVYRLLTSVGGRIAVSRDGGLLAVAGASQIEGFDTRHWRRLWSVPVELPFEPGGPCAFSANGQWLGVSLNSHDAVLLSPTTGRVLARFKPPVAPLVLGVNFRANDTQLLVTTMRGLYVWDLSVVRRKLSTLGLDWLDERPGELLASERVK